MGINFLAGPRQTSSSVQVTAGFVPSGRQGFMGKDNPVAAFFSPGGSDVQKIPENCSVMVSQGDFVYGKTDFMFVPHIGQYADTNNIFPGPFKEF